MAMFENFPYTDMHNLNLDWIIKIAKDFLDQYTHIQQLITDGETSLQTLTTDGLQQLQDKADTLETLLQEWYNTHSEDISEELASALSDISSALNNAITTISQNLDSANTAFDSHAEAKAAQTIESIPDDYSALAASVLQLEKLVTIHRLSFNVNRFLAFGDYTVDITSDAVLVSNDGFYQEGQHITSVPNTHYYKLDVTNYDDVYLDRVTPAYYDVYTLLDADNLVINYKYNDPSISTVQDIIAVNTRNAKWMLLSDDAYNNPFKLMTFPVPTINYAYTNNISIDGINSERFNTYITSKIYVDGVLTSVSSMYRYVEYNVMGLRYIKLYTRTQGWEDIYDLIDKDGNVIAHEMVQTTGNYERIIYVQNATLIRISVLGTDMPKIRIFARNQYNNNKYAGKKIAVIGDSWVEYNNTNTENFIDLTCKDLGIENRNYAISGAGYKATENNGTAFYQMAQSVDLSDCNVVFLFGSGNENTNIANNLLGVYTDNTIDTICGCVNVTIDNILTRYPNIKIAIIAPGAWASFPYTNENNNMIKLVNALKQIAKYRGVPFLNLYEESNLRPWDSDFANTYQPDGVHPNNDGHKFFYRIVKNFVESLLI